MVYLITLLAALLVTGAVVFGIKEYKRRLKKFQDMVRANSIVRVKFGKKSANRRVMSTSRETRNANGVVTVKYRVVVKAADAKGTVSVDRESLGFPKSKESVDKEV